MAEKFRYGPLVYNCFGDEDDSGNYWWAGSPPVAYEEESGLYRIPVDKYGNQCLPAECILHPNCRVEEWDDHVVLGKIPNILWCRSWFEENFLVIDDYTVCRYIVRWMWWNHKNKDEYKRFFNGKRSEEVISEIWPDVTKS
jgi:hypothetical protein